MQSAGIKNLIFGRNITTNQLLDLRSYDYYFFAEELIHPLGHLPKYLQETCGINGEKRQTWVSDCILELEQYLGKRILPITSNQIEWEAARGSRFEMHLPSGEYTHLKGPIQFIINNNHSERPPNTFTGFYSKYFNAPPTQYNPVTAAEKKYYKQLIDFLQNTMPGYEVSRTKIDPLGTSKLSPCFSLGIISFEHLIDIVQQKLEPTPSYQEFERQCHWILYCKLRARELLDKDLPPPLTPAQESLFHQWANGDLPEHNPVDWTINKYMKLLRMGVVLSNRFRLMTSHYLVKKLGIDWRYGELYFRNALIDSHPLVNYYNWRWQCVSNRFFNGYNLQRQLQLHGN